MNVEPHHRVRILTFGMEKRVCAQSDKIVGAQRVTFGMGRSVHVQTRGIVGVRRIMVWSEKGVV